MLNVKCRLSARGGKSAEGGAAMSMGNVWSFPAPGVDYDVTLGAMKALAEKIAKNHAGVHGVRASARRELHAGARVPEGGRGSHARIEAAAAGAEAVHAGDGESRSTRRSTMRMGSCTRSAAIRRAAKSSCATICRTI